MHTLLFCSFLLFAQNVFSQPIPVETLVGHKRVYGFSLINRQFSDSTRFGFFSLTSFNGTYDNKGNELVTCNQLTFALTKRLKIAAGTSFNGLLEFFPSAGLQYTWFKGPFLVVFNPGFEFNTRVATQNFGIFQWQPELTPKWNLYTRIQGLFIHSLGKTGSHERSFYHLRTGLTNNNYTFGVGLNADYFGPLYTVIYNFGGFLRYEFR
ncbi:MAG: hypothetical protein K0R65_1444 [Crocinitomicaceae bacterium]|jgi:hypothetical protein|nr:hypothetical protein [Crocinitomicaceae bacterium]